MLNDIMRKQRDTLYIKKGKKYIPVSDPWAREGLRDGWWLVGVNTLSNSSTTIREQVLPDKAPLYAAAQEIEEKLVGIIRKATEARPKNIPLTPQQKTDWDLFIKKHGDSFNILEYPSFYTVANDILKVLLNIVDKHSHANNLYK